MLPWEGLHCDLRDSGTWTLGFSFGAWHLWQRPPASQTGGQTGYCIPTVPQAYRVVCTDDFYSGDTVCLGGGLWRTELDCCCRPSRAHCVYSPSVCWSIGQLSCTGFSSALFLLCGFGCGVHDCAQEHDKSSYSLPHVGLIQFLDFLGQLFTLLNCKSEFLWLC